MNKISSNKNFISLVLAVAMLFISALVSAEEDSRSHAINSKLKFLSWLVNDSPVVQRVVKSTDVDAIAQLDNAKSLLEQAQIQFDDGNFVVAEEKIAAGIKEMSRVSRKIKDEERVKSASKKLFHEMNERIQSFMDAFTRISQEKNDGLIEAMLDRDKLKGLMRQADGLYQEGQFALANHQLKKASDMLDQALTSARHKDVLIHELNFDSAEDEYEYEIRRNESYVMLIRLLQDKQTVSDASRLYIAKIVEANVVVVEEAVESVEKGDLVNAIAILEKGTDKLSRALRMAGAPF